MRPNPFKIGLFQWTFPGYIFLAVVSYYRKFIAGFPETASPDIWATRIFSYLALWLLEVI